MLSYESGTTGERLSLSSDHIRGRIKKAGFYDFKWSANVTKQTIGAKLNDFEKAAAEYSLILDFLGTKEERAEYANTFFELTEGDLIEKTPGRLYFKDYYIECYVIGSAYNGQDKRTRAVQKKLDLYVPYPFWIRQEKKQFFIQEAVRSEEGLDFPTDFPFDFTPDKIGHQLWHTEHYTASQFQIVVYGPCTDPEVLINGYPYKVFTQLETGDYMIIDSRLNTVEKYMKNGQIVNLYNSRQFTPSIFEKVPGGTLTVDWSGKFGFDITLFLERSEPKW